MNRTDDLSDMKEKLKDYLTEHEYQEYTQDSMFPSVLEAAKDQDCQIKLKKLRLHLQMKAMTGLNLTMK